MKRAMYYIATISIGVLSAATACRKLYEPKTAMLKSGYLVVEGSVNPGSGITDSTIFHLSRTVSLTSTNINNPELGAIVTIHGGNAGAAGYTLSETGNGYYKLAGGLDLDPNGHYYVTINTTDSRKYTTDSLTIKNAPPIDSLTWKWEQNGVNTYVNTHDPNNKTTYYRWSYTETYIIRSVLQSDYILVTTPKDTIVPRTPSQEITICWVTDNSNNITLGSSARLSQDIITHAIVASVPGQSEKIYNRYSILVTQYALSEAEFNYWQQLKKNTEQLGSVFDPQPSEIPGNVRCVSNPSEKVLGFVSAGKPSQARIFVDNAQLSGWVSFSQAEEANCGEVTLLFHKMVAPNQYINEVASEIYTGQAFVLEPVVDPNTHLVIGYTATGSQGCADCTLRGTSIRPIFWTDRQ
jgi:uncharacterized protein DUF4249